MTPLRGLIRLLCFDASSIVVAAALLPLGFWRHQPWFVFSVIVLVIGFALGAHAAIVQTQRLAPCVVIILSSVCVWLLCVYFVMIFWLNTFGS